MASGWVVGGHDGGERARHQGGLHLPALARNFVPPRKVEDQKPRARGFQLLGLGGHWLGLRRARWRHGVLLRSSLSGGLHPPAAVLNSGRGDHRPGDTMACSGYTLGARRTLDSGEDGVEVFLEEFPGVDVDDDVED